MKYISLAIVMCVAALGVGGCGKSKAPAAADKQSEAVRAMEAQLGVPVYPRATQDDNFATGENDLGGTVTMVSFTTEDGLDEVTAFYRKELEGYKEREEQEIRGSRVRGFTRVAGKESSLIVIEQPQSGSTKIAVTVTKAAKAQTGGE